MRTRGRRAKKIGMEFEVDLKPMINLLVVLIPFLLTCAEFSKITLVDINLPGRMEASEAVSRENEDALNLTVIITDYTMTIGARGGFLPYTNYREFHRYASKSDQAVFTVEYNPKAPNVPVISPSDKKKMTPQERNFIDLYACERTAKEDSGKIIFGYYDHLGTALINENGRFVTSLRSGDKVFSLLTKKQVEVRNASSFTRKPLSAYDMLTASLFLIKDKYKGQGMPDENDIIIAAEDNIAYDKIIQIIDRCHIAGFSNVSIAKMKG